jgi:hypothetical protein
MRASSADGRHDPFVLPGGSSCDGHQTAACRQQREAGSSLGGADIKFAVTDWVKPNARKPQATEHTSSRPNSYAAVLAWSLLACFTRSQKIGQTLRRPASRAPTVLLFLLSDILSRALCDLPSGLICSCRIWSVAFKRAHVKGAPGKKTCCSTPENFFSLFCR